MMPDKRKEIAEQVLSRAENKEAAERALYALFPGVVRSQSEEEASQARLSRRIGCRQFAASYFRLSPEPISWPRSETEAIFGLSEPADSLDRALRYIELFSDGDRPRLTRLFLEDLRSNSSVIANRGWISALIRRAEDFLQYDSASSRHAPTRTDGFQLIGFVIYQSLKAFQIDERPDAAETAVGEHDDISIISYVLRLATADQHPSGRQDLEERLFDDEVAKRLRHCLLERVKQIASSGTFWEQLRPWEILWFWWSCHDDDNLRNFTEACLKDPNALRVLISSSISTVFSTEGNYEHVDLQSLSCIVDVQKMKEAAERLFAATDQESDELLVIRFRAAVDRWKDSPRSRQS